MEHFIDRCECGLVIAQCRCPSPSKVESVSSPCIHTEEEKAAGRQDHPRAGTHWHGRGPGRVVHDDHPDSPEGAHNHPGIDGVWYGNPDVMGLTDDPTTEPEGVMFALPGAIMAAMQQEAVVAARSILQASQMADISAVLVNELTNVLSANPDGLPVPVIHSMWTLAGAIAAFWRARSGVTHHPANLDAWHQLMDGMNAAMAGDGVPGAAEEGPVPST